MHYSIFPAKPSQADDLTELYLMAGGGLMEFLFDGLIASDVIYDIICKVVTETDSELSYLNACVAIDNRTQKIVGGCNFYSSEKHRVSNEMRMFIPPARLQWVEKIFTTRQGNSLYVNALSVYPAYRRQGIGKQLLAKMIEQAKLQGYDSLSLIVWNDNIEARALYQAYGFRDVQHIAIEPHEMLPHDGGCTLMVYDVVKSESLP